MPGALPSNDLRAELEEAHDRIEGSDSISLVRGSVDYLQEIRLNGYTLPEVVQLSTDLGANVVYSSVSETDDGEIEWVRLSFVRDGVAHTQYTESSELAKAKESELEEQDDELERKQSLAEEILERYTEVMNDAQEYRLRHNVADIQMERLLTLQERLQERKEQQEREDRIDEEIEQELAEAVYESQQFDRQFNQMDTEMLLRQLDVDFDDGAVRIEEVHRRAKSLLKLNG